MGLFPPTDGAFAVMSIVGRCELDGSYERCVECGNVAVRQVEAHHKKQPKRDRKAAKMVGGWREGEKCRQHPDFPGGHPPEYYPSLKLLDFADRTGYGIFSLRWPSTSYRLSDRDSIADHHKRITLANATAFALLSDAISCATKSC
jgi:hypothetical protein